MSTTALPASVAASARGKMGVAGRAARRRRALSEIAAVSFGILVVIWTLMPLYNIVMVALEAHNDVFTDAVWPRHPSLASFWIVVTQGYWYLEYFWHQFGNSLYVGATVTILTLAIG